MEFTGKRRRTIESNVAAYKRSVARSEASVNSARRLCFSPPRREQTVSSFYSGARRPLQPVDMNEVFVPESPERAADCAMTWQQGETLPTPHQAWSQRQMLSPSATALENCSQVGSNVGQIQSMLQIMQSSIEANFKDVKGRLTDLEVRITNVEENHKQLSLNSSAPTSSSSESVTEFGRKCRSPPELQYEVRKVHGSLSDDNQLLLEERIDSRHNKSVVSNIIKEIGTAKFTERQIEGAVKSHMKYLRDNRQLRSPAVQHRVRIRSHQQRIYERRSNMVKGKEAKKWKFVTPDMMSEEEEERDSFVRHKPSWRSDTFNRFLEKLEGRYKVKHP